MLGRYPQQSARARLSCPPQPTLQPCPRWPCAPGAATAAAASTTCSPLTASWLEPAHGYAVEQLDLALILRLAAEFQGFCRDLQSEGTEFACAQSSIFCAGAADVFKRLFTARRALDVGNAHVASLNADFGRFERSLWDGLQAADRRTATRRRALEQLNCRRGDVMGDCYRYGDHVLIPWLGRGDEAMVLDGYESVGKPYLLLEVGGEASPLDFAASPTARQAARQPATFLRMSGKVAAPPRCRPARLQLG